MKHAKPFALLTVALALTGCASSTPPAKPTPLDWNMPGMQLGGDRGLPLHVDSPCRKRGCDNDKLFFNPGKTEPSVTTIHRGW
ncbi:hypothetical protein N5F23_11655 [Pseudomonas sichuanensis]|uniref:hypothetical protein n=1 Tax=Pseudomonas sichuanensis TaxID=2213015 RepID=UPI00244A31CF|nr:hypothetical protein [Pseudomonas sichuanensis]MDH0730537.1 hypothetical protein [Pseudomonas sichuanensis]MDH1583248.1 hypothetical protein [Pseudomonas sichuanensis]MDH1591673.1 hypothetical protein [Pseudomonas sichuanensis]MDH1596473.1 hypothetical protein [Pseudomonas sichuanensis]